MGEVTLITVIFFVYAGWPPPDVNESHYLAKAKHYWDPNWCAGDLFLESANTHLLFYWAFGWLSRWLPLETVAWIGRCLVWVLQSIAWQRLSHSVIPRPLISLLTATLFLMFCEHLHMAGEWVVGGLEAKGIAYAFVWFGLAALVKGKWQQMCVCFAVASAWHILVGGWSCVVGGSIWLCSSNRPRAKQFLCSMFLTCCLSLPGLAPALMLNWGTPAATILEANHIHVFERLSHHLLIHRFPNLFIFRHFAAIAAWCVLWKYAPTNNGARRLQQFVAGAIAIALTGAVIDQTTLYAPDLAASLLKFYWFRLSDATVPVGLSFGMVLAWQHLRTLTDHRYARAVQADWLLVGGILVASGWLGGEYLKHVKDLRPAADRPAAAAASAQPAHARLAYHNWSLVCRWFAINTKPNDIVVTPRGQQTFKWYAGRPEFVGWKDVPQDAVSVVEWWRREQTLRGYGAVSSWKEGVLAASQTVAVRYVLVDRRQNNPLLPYPQVYPTILDFNEQYIVYKVPIVDSSAGSK